jgi:hypothetical protein
MRRKTRQLGGCCNHILNQIVINNNKERKSGNELTSKKIKYVLLFEAAIYQLLFKSVLPLTENFFCIPQVKLQYHCLDINLS